MSDRFLVAGISINGTVVGGVRSQGLESRLNEINISADGQVDPTFSAIMESAPMFSVETHSIKALLALVGINGLAISSTVILYLVRTAANGIRASGSVHMTITINAGMVIPRTIQASQGQPATYRADIIAVASDGETSPVSFATNVALPAGLGVVQLFTVGPCNINGTNYPGVQSFSFDFGLQEELAYADGGVIPNRVHIAQRRPRLVVGFDDASVVASLAALFVAQGATDSVVYLRQMDRLGTRKSAASSSHISFGVDDGIWKAVNLSGDHPNYAGPSLECMPVYDGTNAIVNIQADQAIA